MEKAALLIYKNMTLPIFEYGDIFLHSVPQKIRKTPQQLVCMLSVHSCIINTDITVLNSSVVECLIFVQRVPGSVWARFTFYLQTLTCCICCIYICSTCSTYYLLQIPSHLCVYGLKIIYEMRCLFVAAGLNALFIVLPYWDNTS